MSEWKIYHNPKCTKSRQTLALLQEKGIEPTVIEYLKTPPTANELKLIIQSLGAEASDIVRTKEEDYKNLKFDISDTEVVIENLVKTPKLLERPIVLHGDKATIGRPPENINKLF